MLMIRWTIILLAAAVRGAASFAWDRRLLSCPQVEDRTLDVHPAAAVSFVLVFVSNENSLCGLKSYQGQYVDPIGDTCKGCAAGTYQVKGPSGVLTRSRPPTSFWF